MKSLAELTSQNSLSEGWVLKKTKKNMRYTQDQRSFLDGELEKCQASKTRLDPKYVEKLMREARGDRDQKRFSPEQRLTANQISSYVQRKLNKLRKARTNGIEPPKLTEEESEQIIEEMNNESGKRVKVHEKQKTNFYYRRRIS